MPVVNRFLRLRFVFGGLSYHRLGFNAGDTVEFGGIFRLSLFPAQSVHRELSKHERTAPQQAKGQWGQDTTKRAGVEQFQVCVGQRSGSMIY